MSVQRRGPIAGLRDLSELLSDEEPRASTFLRGLTIGALVGAAIAGSTIWGRRRKVTEPVERSDPPTR